MSADLKCEPKKEVIDLAARIREGKGLEDIDYDKVELVRGETPEDIEEKCLDICKNYLSRNWTQQTLDTIHVRRITGGLMNQIYYCGLKVPDNNEKVPQEVAIKLYGEFRAVFCEDENENKINQLVISLLFSERNIGPKIYGMFDGGMIQKFYKQRAYGRTEQKDPKLIDKVFRTLARIHSMDFPIKKNGNRMMDSLEKSVNEGSDILKEVEDIDVFKKHDVKTEIQWFKGIIKRLNSPVVFCHNDYRSSNLLITEPNDELVVCDYDLSGYNYRGTDFSFMMREWNKKHFMESMASIEDIPLDDQLRTHIEIYVDESQKIDKSFSDNENNSVDHILKEAKIFVMFTYLYFMSFALKGPPKDMVKEEEKDPNNNNEKPAGIAKMHMMLEMGYTNYHKIKDILNKQKVFDDL